MQKLAKQALNKIKYKYSLDYNSKDEDIIQDAILYLIQNRGDIEKNFKNEEKTIIKMIYYSLNKFIMYSLISMNQKKMKAVSLNKKFKLKDNQKEIQEIIPSNADTEKEALERIEEETIDINKAVECIEKLKYYIEEGYSRKEALKNTANSLNIGKEEMLELMQIYLRTNGKLNVRRRVSPSMK